ncbi:MAG: diacylglycerol kinase family lipid kinase [Myxococcales bacterium]|nr:diacylglycerol kinase family lipid kinase [Myxococcales bacterium]
MTSLPTLVVLNPASSSGRTKKRWLAIEPIVRTALPNLTLYETTGPGDATAAVRRALQTGPHHVLCIGGDGTNHEVINGFFTEGQTTAISPESTFSFVVSGTGGDFARTYPTAQDPENLVKRIAENDHRPMDLINCTFTGDDGGERSELCINIASLGLGGWVCRRVDSRPKGWLPADALFFFTSVEALFKTRPFPVRLRVDGGEERALQIRNVVAANGRFQGGGMEIAPDADAADGELDLVISGPFAPFSMIWASRLIYRGTGHTHPLINMERARRVEVLPDGQDVFLEMDGEAMGRAPVTFEVVPSAVRAIV